MGGCSILKEKGPFLLALNAGLGGGVVNALSLWVKVAGLNPAVCRAVKVERGVEEAE